MKHGLGHGHLTAVDWRAGDGGLVSGARYHDGLLTGLEIAEAGVRVSVSPVGGGLTVFEFSGAVEFGSIGLIDKDIVVDVCAFRLDAGASVPLDVVEALYGGRLRDADIDMAVAKLCAKNAGRLLVGLTCAVTSRLSVLADTLRVAKAGY